jgi:hypothetical protein
MVESKKDRENNLGKAARDGWGRDLALCDDSLGRQTGLSETVGILRARSCPF